jgi:hypothetical protein
MALARFWRWSLFLLSCHGKVSSMPKLTQERLREVLHYDPLTGEWTWQVDRGRIRKGSKAGTTLPDGYRQIKIDQHLYQAGRLAVLWMTGVWPARIVDHRNGVRDDDRWRNLRAASYSQNGANRTPDRHSAVPFKGVTWDRSRGKFMAQITVNSRYRFLGRFTTPKAAHARYCKAAAEHFGEFARF